MIVKAKNSFCGVVSMTMGEIRDISDKSIVTDLLKAGYVEEIKEEKKTVKKAVEKGESK
jgi:hypothetical protein